MVLAVLADVEVRIYPNQSPVEVSSGHDQLALAFNSEEVAHDIDHVRHT